MPGDIVRGEAMLADYLQGSDRHGKQRRLGILCKLQVRVGTVEAKLG